MKSVNKDQHLLSRNLHTEDISIPKTSLLLASHAGKCLKSC